MTEDEVKLKLMTRFNKIHKYKEEMEKDREKYGDKHYNEVNIKVAEQTQVAIGKILHEDFGVSWDELGIVIVY